MEWSARTPSLWDSDSQLSCDAGDYKPPGGRAGDCSKAAFGSTSSSTGSSLIVPGMAAVSPPPAIEFQDDHKGGSAISFQDAAYSSPETVAEEKTSTPIGLKFGQRTYFEDASQADQSAVVLSSKKLRCEQQEQAIYCQVEGCDVDLSGSKEYYRKHRVCKDHTKCPRVIITGQERRFCQQCSRWPAL